MCSMLEIRGLYTQPALFEPIVFTRGLNLIFGERAENSDKNNGVGKSLCVEFINFALLKKKADSRLARIPPDVLPIDTVVCLDILIGGEPYCLRRSIADAESPQLVGSNGVTEFAKLEDATAYLATLVFERSPAGAPSFRTMMGPLIRDERSEFKSLVKFADTDRNVPDNYEAHLYLLGIETGPYLSLVDNWRQIKSRESEQTAIKRNVKLLRNKDIKSARADVNELSAAAEKIGREIDALETQAGYDAIKDEALALEHRMDELRRRKSIVSASILKLKPVTRRVEIDDVEVGAFYDSLKAGLGSIVSKDLNEVIGFKAKIEAFQNQVLAERSAKLTKERNQLTSQLRGIDARYKELLAVLDQEGNLKNLRQVYEAYRVKTEELGQLKAFIGEYEALGKEIQALKVERQKLTMAMQVAVADAETTLLDVERTILEIHEFIQGDRNALFTIDVSDKKHVIDLVMRIRDDGSHSINREKVFIYDFALLTNSHVSERHPGLLVHDNIFEVDQDTLIKSVRYIIDQVDSLADRQYILTLNSDRLELEPNLLAELELFVRARFTKDNKFLGRTYQEIRGSA